MNYSLTLCELFSATGILLPLCSLVAVWVSKKKKRSQEDNLRGTRLLLSHLMLSWSQILQKKGRCKTFTPLILFTYPRPWALAIKPLPISLRGRHSSWGVSLLCSFFAWQRNKVSLCLYSKTLSAYFYSAVVPRFWQHLKWGRELIMLINWGMWISLMMVTEFKLRILAV